MPPFAVPVPAVNGHYFSYASIVVSVGGIRITGFKSINYKAETELSDVYGTNSHVLGSTRGKSKITSDAELYTQDWENMRTALGGPGYGERRFNIDVSYAELGTPVKMDTVFGCRIIGTDYANAEGTDASTVKLTFNVFRLFEAGLHSQLRPPVGIGF